MMNFTELDPQVQQLIIDDTNEMSEIYYDQQQRTLLFSAKNDSQEVKDRKKKCLHFKFNTTTSDNRNVVNYNIPGLQPCVVSKEIERNGKKEKVFICEHCQRICDLSFSKESLQKIMDCIEVLNGLCVVGPLMGMTAEPLEAIRSVKSLLSSIATLLLNLQVAATNDEKRSSKSRQTTGDFEDSFLSPTSFKL